MKLDDSIHTTVTIANASELAANILNGVLGDDVADTFNGSPLSRGIIYNLTLASIQSKMAPHLKDTQNA